MDCFNGAKYCNGIDLKLGYYQICIMEKIAMKTKYGSYEFGLYKFLMMPFGLSNTASMFTIFMNFMFHEKLNKFVIIYIDDILVYSKKVEEHAKHF
jgi:hypothetical protein